MIELNSEELRNNKEVVQEAVKQNGGALQHASEKLKNDIKQSNINIMDKNVKNNNQIVDFLKNQLKYLGFGESEKIHEALIEKINSPKKKFNINISSNDAKFNTLKGNSIDFTLNYSKGNEGTVYLNSFTANLLTKNNEERSHSFKVRKENNVTAKEAINLLEGRSIKFYKSTDNGNEELYIKLKLKDEKNETGNYKIEAYNSNYGIDIDNIIDKQNIIGNKNEIDNVKKNLEKGNITKVKFLHENKEKDGYAVLNPQWKMLNLYDNNMVRVNTNKDSYNINKDISHDKNNVREQSIVRKP